jgi:hypothetical protein
MKTTTTSGIKRLSLVILTVLGMCLTQKASAGYTSIIHSKSQKLYAASNINGLTVYPNPTQNSVTLNATVKPLSNIEIRVVNILGVTILERNETASVGYFEYKFDLSKFPNGMYIIEIKSLDQDITTRIIKN